MVNVQKAIDGSSCFAVYKKIKLNEEGQNFSSGGLAGLLAIVLSGKYFKSQYYIMAAIFNTLTNNNRSMPSTYIVNLQPLKIVYAKINDRLWKSRANSR